MENLPLGKSAGPNRVPNAVYKLLSDLWVPIFTRMANEIWKDGKPSKTMMEGDISFLYKGKGEREDPRMYRPITLLNTDYKIYTRVLARRMKKVVHEFVSECQKGFVPTSGSWAPGCLAGPWLPSGSLAA